MSRQPEDLAAPPNQRPPHINPQWWYRATWHARQQAINAYNRDTRTNDTPNVAPEPIEIPTRPLTRDEKATIVEQLLDEGHTPVDIANHLNTTLAGLETALRRANRVDLARPFSRARGRANCTHCGARTYQSELCRTCAAQAREARKRSADDCLDEIEELLQLGRTHEEAARHVGKSASALEKAARRHNRGDLARAYQRLRSRSRKCVDCGQSVGKASQRCKPCAGLVREMDQRALRRTA